MKSVTGRVLAIVGTLVVWIVIIGAAVLAAQTLRSGESYATFFLFFMAYGTPLGILGTALLFASSAVEGHERVLMGLGVVVSIAAAVVAFAEFPPMSDQMIQAVLAAYSATLAAVGVGGLLLIRRLFRRESSSAPGVPAV